MHIIVLFSNNLISWYLFQIIETNRNQFLRIVCVYCILYTQYIQSIHCYVLWMNAKGKDESENISSSLITEPFSIHPFNQLPFVRLSKQWNRFYCYSNHWWIRLQCDIIVSNDSDPLNGTMPMIKKKRTSQWNKFQFIPTTFDTIVCKLYTVYRVQSQTIKDYCYFILQCMCCCFGFLYFWNDDDLQSERGIQIAEYSVCIGFSNWSADWMIVCLTFSIKSKLIPIAGDREKVNTKFITNG